jgi:hypothetical protein
MNKEKEGSWYLTPEDFIVGECVKFIDDLPAYGNEGHWANAVIKNNYVGVVTEINPQHQTRWELVVLFGGQALGVEAVELEKL